MSRRNIRFNSVTLVPIQKEGKKQSFLEHQLNASHYRIGFMTMFKLTLTSPQVWSFQVSPNHRGSAGLERAVTCSGDLRVSARTLKSVSLPLQLAG